MAGKNGHKPIKHLRDLLPDTANARKHSPRNVGLIETALGEVGAGRSIVIDETGAVLAGNATVEAAARAGIERVKVVDADGESIIAVRRSGLTARQKKRLALLDNAPNSPEANPEYWDDAVIAELAKSERELLDGVFRDDELNRILAGQGGESIDAEPQIDRAAELLEKWQVKTGDLWRIGEHRLLCGDSTKREDVERVMGGEKAELMLIDPPYGDLVIFDKNKMVGKSNAAKTKSYGDHYQGEGVFDLAPVLECAKEFYKNSVIWGGNYFPHLLGPRTSWLVWDKRAGEHSWYSDVELAWSDLPIPAKLFSYTWQGMIRKGEHEERYHPTQKPVALMEWILKDFTPDARIVMDLFGGSGVVMLACQNLSRRCRAIEISPGYVAVCLERMATAFPDLVIERVKPNGKARK